jgi:hypothetical protein
LMILEAPYHFDPWSCFIFCALELVLCIWTKNYIWLWTSKFRIIQLKGYYILSCWVFEVLNHIHV